MYRHAGPSCVCAHAPMPGAETRCAAPRGPQIAHGHRALSGCAPDAHKLLDAVADVSSSLSRCRPPRPPRRAAGPLAAGRVPPAPARPQAPLCRGALTRAEPSGSGSLAETWLRMGTRLHDLVTSPPGTRARERAERDRAERKGAVCARGLSVRVRAACCAQTTHRCLHSRNARASSVCRW